MNRAKVHVNLQLSSPLATNILPLWRRLRSDGTAFGNFESFFLEMGFEDRAMDHKLAL